MNRITEFLFRIVLVLAPFLLMAVFYLLLT